MPPTPVSTSAVAPRRVTLIQQLRAMFEDFTGMDMTQAPTGACFVDLGLDSLTLTQAALQLKKHYHIDVTFRELIDEYSTFDSLAERLEDVLPPPEPVAGMPEPKPAEVEPMGRPASYTPVPLAYPSADPVKPADALTQHAIIQQIHAPVARGDQRGATNPGGSTNVPWPSAS